MIKATKLSITDVYAYTPLTNMHYEHGRISNFFRKAISAKNKYFFTNGDVFSVFQA
jgi:hypothetical protein